MYTIFLNIITIWEIYNIYTIGNKMLIFTKRNRFKKRDSTKLKMSLVHERLNHSLSADNFDTFFFGLNIKISKFKIFCSKLKFFPREHNFIYIRLVVYYNIQFLLTARNTGNILDFVATKHKYFHINLQKVKNSRKIEICK